jgi:hypothetical protein
MIKASGRLGILAALCFVLVLQASGQDTQPTLENTMNFIASTLNNRGTISWVTNLNGATFTTTNSLEQINADSSTCSLGWTSVDTESRNKTVQTHSVKLQTVSSVDVQSYSRSKSSREWEIRASPEIYLVEMKTNAPIAGHSQSYKKDKSKSHTKLPNDREAKIEFSDEQTANRVAHAIRQAASLCGKTRSGR